MKHRKEFVNGFIIFLGIAIYFLCINVLGLAHLYFLRLFNVLFIFYGVNKTLHMNLEEGETNFVNNAISASLTAVSGVVFSIIGLIIYSYSRGGDAYVATLSESFLFGGNPSVPTYSICLLFEGIVSSMIVTLILMLYWKKRYIPEG